MSNEWKPNSIQQTRFLASPAFEALFGGSAGPGKTDCLIMEALRQVAHPNYVGIIFRRTFRQLDAGDGIVQRSLRWYPAYGGRYNGGKYFWTFPSGSRIYFAYMEHDGDEYNYDGPQYSFIGFDELTAFPQKQYLYMFSRCRPAAPGLRAYVRSATAPGNHGHRWVKQRFVTRDIVNRLRYFAPVEGADGKSMDTEVDRHHPDALSRAFYPALMDDNPSINPAEYKKRIRAMGDPVRIAQLELGDWDAEYKEGLIYDTWSSLSWPDGNVTSEAAYRPDQPVYWAVDDGYVYGDGPGSINYHPRVILFVQDNALGGLDVIDEYAATEENPAATVAKVLTDANYRWAQYQRPAAAYVPSEAALLRGEIHKHGLITINATHRVGEGIKALRQLVVNADGARLLRVNPLCQGLIYEFGVYRSNDKGKADTGELVPLKVDDHSLDALRYLTYKRRYFLTEAVA